MTTIITLINSVYDRESPLTYTYGKVHEYPGVTINLYWKGNLKFTMYDLITDILEDIPKVTKTG